MEGTSFLRDIDLDTVRAFYAEEVRIAAQVESARIVQAFARVPREKYLGPGPWSVAHAELGMGGAAYVSTDDVDPRSVYHNVAIALDAGRNLTNGQPGSLARWMDALSLEAGSRVYHMGCGAGYYTAIMAEVVGPDGRIVASEIDAALAAKARENLASYSHVEVRTGDGAEIDPGPCDAVFVNAGVTHPHPVWFKRLEKGGRMVFPLTVAMSPSLGKGMMVLVRRSTKILAARILSFVMIYSSASCRDPQIESQLGPSIATGALLKLRSVRLDGHEPSNTCLLHAPEVCFSSADAA